MKKMQVLKTFFALLMVSALLTILAACGAGNNVAGTYTKSFSSEELAGNTWHNGFITALGLSQLNTLKLNEDGSYEYTKLVAKFDDTGNASEDESSPQITFTFTGKYTSTNDKVTLAIPTESIFDESWGSIAEGGYITNSSGKASAGDKVVPKEGEEYDPLNVFLTPYYLESGKHDQDVIVTINKDNSSFVYEEEVNSEDE